jgi:para-aminobenzoate synthetase component 1
MDLLSKDLPYWAYIPSEQTKWNKKPGLYILNHPETNGDFNDEILLIPYHFENRENAFNKSRCLHLKIKDHIITTNNFCRRDKQILHHIRLSHKPSFDDYKKSFHFIKSKLQRGDIYEINFCLEFHLEINLLHPIYLFETIYEKTLAPYSMLLRLNDTLLFCFSPELFLKREGQKLITEPIKGTLKKGGSDFEDKRNEFIKSVKEKAENAMAVDVARNDFSRIAKRGSVCVPELFVVKELKNIVQMYSRVECNIKENVGWYDILSVTFPMASMTGAPKISAMEIIRQTEHFERGYYSGSIGIFNTPEDAVLNVVIRTIEYDINSRKGRFCAGSAITWKSEAVKEYEECVVKTKSILESDN